MLNRWSGVSIFLVHLQGICGPLFRYFKTGVAIEELLAVVK